MMLQVLFILPVYLMHFLGFVSLAVGRAMVALSAVDFGNFITHPLMQPPNPPSIQALGSNDKLVFMKENVSVDPSLGTVTFYGSYAGATWEFRLMRANGGNKAHVDVFLFDGSNFGGEIEPMTRSLSEATSRFFNEMVFELDGTFLSFNDMMLTDKGKEPSCMLSLTITVKKFPSPGLEF
jgi:hypothetical protein